MLVNGTRKGLKLTFVDQGAGIADIERALQDGFTSGSGLGLGPGGARRLCDEFDIQSQPGRRTRHDHCTKSVLRASSLTAVTNFV